MSTRSCIAIATAKGFRSIYCHCDGDPGGVGRILLVHHNDAEKVKALLRLGDLSVLGEQLGERHDFHWMAKVAASQIAFDPRFRMCRAYGRDRGEAGCGARYQRSSASLADVAEECGAQWIYLWCDNRWLFAAVQPGLTLDQMSLLAEMDCALPTGTV